MFWLVLAASGEVPPREGVLELMDEARAKGLLVGVCSAATKGSAVAVVQSLLGPQRFEVGGLAAGCCDCQCMPMSLAPVMVAKCPMVQQVLGSALQH